MDNLCPDNWESVVVCPETVIEKIRPGMSIFLGTAMAEPRTMVRHLMTSTAGNLVDLELIQLVKELSFENFFFRVGCGRSHRTGPRGSDSQSIREDPPVD
jgi:hypothetical protein